MKSQPYHVSEMPTLVFNATKGALVTPAIPPPPNIQPPLPLPLSIKYSQLHIRICGAGGYLIFGGRGGLSFFWGRGVSPIP